ncbi:MAG: bifunctional UDP-3-O-[3-hydroxymyristoyl] N-acetylglucosamine deacetylase/3-hydroxyacyl-ACP dehydratase [Gemmatimonadales bacterium]
MKQRTIAGEARLAGKGLHSGRAVELVLRPAAADQGILFRRTDVEGARDIPASVDRVVDVERQTVLGDGDVRVRTVEHLLAATSALGVDNLIVELNAEEPPAADGSAAPFVELIDQAGIKPLKSDAPTWKCTTPFVVSEGESKYAVLPDERAVLSVSIEFDHPLIGRQFSSHDIASDAFAREICPARTFGFFEDAEKLRALGLARGADTQNTVVLTADGLYEGVELRYADEFVRHKILDLAGDLALLGHRVQAQIVAERPGHRGNVEVVKAIAEQIRRQKAARRVDINEIFHILPHRYPFLLVDRVVEYERGVRIVGIKNVTINEPFFMGHFPGLPIMPGVLMVEAMAQVGGLLFMDMVENPEDKVVYFMSLDKVKFRRPVTPGDQIVFELMMVKLRWPVCVMKGVGRVDGKVVAEAELKAQVVDR